MSGHTKGPWQWSNNGAGDLQTSCISIDLLENCKYRGQIAYLQSAEHIDGITMVENEANARLIAAAPDLLEALEDIFQTVEFAVDDMNGAHYLTDEQRDKARAAIARAKGEQA